MECWRRSMNACSLPRPAPVDEGPLVWDDVARPEPREDEVRVAVHACGICRTDLHVVEGELEPRRSPLIPGHQIVGTVEERGRCARRFETGERVGIAWLHRTCGGCEFCTAGSENLCDRPEFTGWTVDGGYAEYVVAPEAFVYPIPDGFADLEAAPLLCAGIIGFRSLRLSGIGPGSRLGLIGFGAAAHVAIQVARHWGAEVYAITRERRHRDLACKLGAVWAGGVAEKPPERLDAAILFAPAGELVPPALAMLRKGGVLVLGGIHMSPIPPLDYSLIYHERVIRSVANNTRADGEEFLRIAAEIPISTEIQTFPLREANRALAELKHDRVRGAAVLRVRDGA
jgi:alcohol dehydrogenase, propanol-preferring